MSQNPGSDIYIGLMSGTSLDGVDIAIVDFTGNPPTTLYAETVAYANDLQQKLRKLIHSQTTTLDELYDLDAALAQTYAEVVTGALGQCGLKREQVAALGCHGQTIRHRPDADPAYTAQIGDPGRLSVLTGITTVADFRRQDIALGGQGAPLAPAFHQYLFAAEQENRVVLNIGGIANITHLPTDPDLPVIGFDTGPGNTLLDHWVSTHRSDPFDRDGDWARTGQVIDEMLDRMLTKEAFFSLNPPKSTGTEYFNPDWLVQWLDPGYKPVDVQATLVELTTGTIAAAIRHLPSPVTRCLVCGGGAHNRYLLERLATALAGIELQTTASLGIDPDFVEASAFAWLARTRLRLEPGNLPDVTAASRATVLGGIYHAD